jgi:calcium/proton exchanger cax
VACRYATFGDATELLIGTYAIRKGLIEVVKASITGSLIGTFFWFWEPLSLWVVLAIYPSQLYGG